MPSHYGLTPAFSTGTMGRPPMDPEQERIARLLEALVTQTPGGLVQSTGETLGMVGDVLGSIGQPQRAEEAGRQVRRTLPDIASALGAGGPQTPMADLYKPGAYNAVGGLLEGMESEVLDKGLGAFMGVENFAGPAGKLASVLGAASMMKAPNIKASKAVQDIVDLSKARQAKPKTVDIWHNSPNSELTGISESNTGDTFSGLFGNEGGSDYGGRYSFKFDIPQDEILSHSDFTNTLPYEKTKAAVEKVAKENGLSVDSDLIDELWDYIAEDKSVFDELRDYDSGTFDEDKLYALTGEYDLGEGSWKLQKMRGQVARELGYSAVEMNDEYGVSTLIVNPNIKPSSRKDLETGAIVDLSKARQTPRQMRLQELADEQVARGEVPGALERGRLDQTYNAAQDKMMESMIAQSKAQNVVDNPASSGMEKLEAGEDLKLAQQTFKGDEAAAEAAYRRTQSFANLDDVEKARLDRAVQQGFNVDAFHGTKGDIESFDPGLLGATTGAPSARRGFFFSADPETANNYARAAEGYELGRRDQIREAVNLAEKEIQRVNLEAAKIDIEARKKAGYYEKLNDLVNKERAGELLNFERQNKMEELDRQMAAEIAKNPAYLETKAKADQLSKDRANIPSDYGMNVLPVKLRLQNPLEYDFGGQSYRDVSYNDLLKQAQEAGNDGAIFRNTTDGGGVTDIYVVFDPSQIRSRYAAFDPNEGASGSLIANAPPILFPLGVGTAAAAYSANQEQ